MAPSVIKLALVATVALAMAVSVTETVHDAAQQQSEKPGLPTPARVSKAVHTTIGQSSSSTQLALVAMALVMALAGYSHFARPPPPAPPHIHSDNNTTGGTNHFMISGLQSWVGAAIDGKVQESTGMSVGMIFLNIVALPFIYMFIKGVILVASLSSDAEWHGFKAVQSLSKLIPINLFLSLLVYAVTACMPHLLFPAVGCGHALCFGGLAMVLAVCLGAIARVHQSRHEEGSFGQNRNLLAALTNFAHIVSMALSAALFSLTGPIYTFVVGFTVQAVYFFMLE